MLPLLLTAAALAACGNDSATRAGPDAGPDAGSDAGPDAGPVLDVTASVLQHHKHASRDGLTVDAAFTHAMAQALTRDTSFDGTVTGKVYAQPLYAASASGGAELVIVATESNQVTALSAATGLPVWQRGADTLGTPVQASTLPCGNIAPTVGVTGTPVIDAASRTLYFDALTTPDAGATQRHLVYGISLDDGATRTGFPVDVQARVGSGFSSSVQGERGALAIAGGTLFVPYGGLFGDCGTYNGWVVGIPLGAPQSVRAWSTRAHGGGIWAPAGLSSDGASIFASTGNTFGATAWSDGEGVFRFPATGTLAPADSFAPANWKALDNADLDLSGVTPLPVHVAGTAPADMMVALGKDGFAYLLSRSAFGGIGGQLVKAAVSSSEIITAPAVYDAPGGTTVAYAGPGLGGAAGCPGSLTALRLTASPPGVQVAFCMNQNGSGSPMATSNGGSETPLLWVAGAEGDNRLHVFDGDTGAVVYAGGGAAEAMGTVQHFQTPIAARGRIFVAGNGKVYAFR